MGDFTKTMFYNVRWIKQEYLPCNDCYREIRGTLGDKDFRCFKCNKEYELDEMMALACVEEAGNQTMCQECATSVQLYMDECKRKENETTT